MHNIRGRDQAQPCPAVFKGQLQHTCSHRGFVTGAKQRPTGVLLCTRLHTHGAPCPQHGRKSKNLKPLFRGHRQGPPACWSPSVPMCGEPLGLRPRLCPPRTPSPPPPPLSCAWTPCRLCSQRHGLEGFLVISRTFKGNCDKKPFSHHHWLFVCVCVVKLWSNTHNIKSTIVAIFKGTIQWY